MEERTSENRFKNKTAQQFSLAEGKIPPNAVEVEKLILGALLIDKKGFTDAYDLISAEIFYDPKHATIFAAISELFKKENNAIDIITVIQELKRTENLALAGGESYVIDLSTRVSSSAHIEQHVRLVLEKFILRSLITMSSNVIDHSYKESTDVFELLEETEKGFFDIANGTIKKGFDTANSLVKQAIENIKAIKDNGGLSGIPTGFTKLDELTSGWQNSDLVIIAARPGMGKTAFMLSMARNITVDQNIPMAIFSLEMASVQLIMRMISSETRIKSENLRKGNLSAEEWNRLYSQISKLENAPLYIDETPALKIYDFRAKCRRLVLQHGVKIIMIDYLQLMTASEKAGNREQEISMISRTLKAVAKELNIPIIALSQLSRSVETRSATNKRPQLSDLRESGAIEQDADIVSFIYRPQYYKLDLWDNDPEESKTSTDNQAEIIIAKHRNGSLDDVRLTFLGEFARFEDLNSNLTVFPPMGESEFSRVTKTINPADAFNSFETSEMPHNKGSQVSGSLMNNFDEEDDSDSEVPY